MGRESKKKTFAAAGDHHKDLESGAKIQQQQLLQQSNNKLKLAHQEAQLMSNQNNNNNNEHAAKDDPHDEMSFCCFIKKKWILFLSMIFTLLITAVLVAMLTINLLDNDDQCSNNFPLQRLSYKLFATKTTYSTAHNYLAASNAYETQYDKSVYPIELPDIFSKSDSLKTIDERQRSLGCRVRQLHYFGRHAARFPNKKTIASMNQLLTDVQARIDLSKFSLNSNNNNNNKTQNATSVCSNPLVPYKIWQSYFLPDQDNLVMESGYEETATIAKRFKSLYPELFDFNQTRVEFGVTEEIRTAQTALMFLKQVENYPLDFCSLLEFPTDGPSDPSKANDIKNNRCFKSFLNKFHKDKLHFHKRCDSLHIEKVPISHNLNLKEPNTTHFISESVSKKLKLSKDNQLTAEETEAINKVCKFESALSGSSIWCNLFSDTDLKFYEYLDDVDDFFNQAFGHPDQWRSACPVTTELMSAFKAARSQDPARSRPEAYFYFTHSEVIAKILAASVELENDQEYSSKKILAHLQSGTVPSARQWRSSLFTPFSANLAFTLYECPKTVKLDSSKPMEFDVSDSSFKVVGSLNEQPIKLDGCSDFVCDLSALQDDGRINKEKRCRLEDICRKNIVVT